MILKKLISHFDVNVFPRVVWILSQPTAFLLKLQQKNLRGQKCIACKTALVPQYLLECCLLCQLFSASLMVVSTEIGYQYVSSLTATVCFIFVNHARNGFFSVIGMCCMCLFFQKTVSSGKNPLKICKTVRNDESTVRP